MNLKDLANLNTARADQIEDEIGSYRLMDLICGRGPSPTAKEQAQLSLWRLACTLARAAERAHGALLVGERVEGGDTAEDYDTGLVVEVDGVMVTVAWDSGVRTTQRASLLRAATTR